MELNYRVRFFTVVLKPDACKMKWVPNHLKREEEEVRNFGQTHAHFVTGSHCLHRRFERVFQLIENIRDCCFRWISCFSLLSSVIHMLTQWSLKLGRIQNISDESTPSLCYINRIEVQYVVVDHETVSLNWNLEFGNLPSFGVLTYCWNSDYRVCIKSRRPRGYTF